MPTNITNTSVTTDDLTVDTNVLKVDSANNRVGIGTTTPSNQLHISESGNANAIQHIQAGVNGYAARIKLTGNNTGGGGYNAIQSFVNGDSTAQWEITGSESSTEDVMTLHTGGSEKVRIDSSGRVTTPNQPSFLMKKYSGGSTAISVNSVWTFDEALSNVGNHANISNGRFTAPVTGSYCFMWHNIGEGTSTVYRSFIRKNGSAAWGTGSYRLESRNYHSAGYPNASAQVVVQLNASDYVDIYLEGGSIYSDTTNGVWFCGFLIG